MNYDGLSGLVRLFYLDLVRIISIIDVDASSTYVSSVQIDPNHYKSNRSTTYEGQTNSVNLD